MRDVNLKQYIFYSQNYYSNRGGFLNRFFYLGGVRRVKAFFDKKRKKNAYFF